jgi:hypothetical protein
MKTLFAAIVVCLGTILPHAQAQQVDAAPAAESAQFKKKNYGGLNPGRKFVFKVEEAIIAKASLGSSKRIKKAPKGIPNYKKGKKIKFKIGKKGELIGPGFKMKLEKGGISAVSNVYTSGISKKSPSTQPSAAIVYKNAKGKPVAVALNFYKVDIKGFQTTTYSVFYGFGDINNN